MSIDGSINLGDLNGGTNAPFTLASDADPGNFTSGAGTLPLYALEGGFADGVTLAAFTLAASGEAGAFFEGVASELALPAFTLAGGFADGVTLAPFTLAATAQAGALVTAQLTLPAFDVAGSLEPPLALPAYALAAQGLAGALAAGSIAPEAFALAAASGHAVDVRLPAFALAGAALAGGVAAGDAQPPAFTLAASARQDTSAQGDLTLGVFLLAADGSAQAVTDAAVTLNAFALQAAGLAGTVASAELTLPLWTASDAAAGFSVVGSATITLPAFVLAGGADAPAGPQASQANPAAVARVVALNTRLKGVTLYEGLAANSFAQFAGVTLAATPEGIVALAGDTDLQGAAIAARVAAGVSDFDLPTLKLVPAAYVGYRASGELELTLITDEHHTHVYRLAPAQGAEAIHAARVKCGRGVAGRYWQWQLANRAGEDFQLAQLTLQVQPLRRGV